MSVLCSEAMAAMRCSCVRTAGTNERGECTNLVLCTLGIQHGDEHVTVAVALGSVCAKDLSEARGRWLEINMRGDTEDEAEAY